MTRWLNSVTDLMRSLAWIAKGTIIIALMVIAYFAFDRDPPFVLLSVEPAQARPGEWVKIRAAVRRDAHRMCSATFSRYIFDASGTRYEVNDGAYASAQMIAQMERENPGRLDVGVQIPSVAAPGRAALITPLEYRCNYTHKWFPIDVTTVMPFTILPP